MSELTRYVEKRQKRDKSFAEGYAVGYEQFKIGVMLRQAREAAGLTQEEVALKLRTKKSAISRIENHADDVRLSTLYRYAQAVGADLHIRLAQA
ncbi:MAG TPA: helix-turn-helix transcriptional regulator [Anaerolineales bacterium]|nr:helix-turn-helix transcriptional regulator [Anaerolineales bacterium]